MSQVILDIYGVPKPQGSKRAWVQGGRARMAESAGEALRTWREDVKQAALAALPADCPYAGPVWTELSFYMPRPLSHWGTGRNAGVLKPSAPDYAPTRPDIDKLVRATLDALKDAGVYRDDGQVVALHVAKYYVPQQRGPGAWILVQPDRSIL
jgi:crossover junction endodeoxyribonuclease RusA